MKSIFILYCIIQQDTKCEIGHNIYLSKVICPLILYHSLENKVLLNIFQIFLCFVNFCLKLGFVKCVAVSPNFGNKSDAQNRGNCISSSIQIS